MQDIFWDSRWDDNIKIALKEVKVKMENGFIFLCLQTGWRVMRLW